jgi:hypothetical protein
MLRNIFAVIVGLVVGSVLNFALVQLNLSLFPLPDGVDLTDPESIGAAIRDMPGTAWILVFAAHLGQAFVGGWVAARLGASRPVLLALIVGALTLAGGIWNALSLSLPAWTWIEMPFYLLVAWLAGRIEEKRRAGAA